MEGTRFDDSVKLLARSLGRRGVMRTVGAAGAALLAVFGGASSGAAKGKKGRNPRHHNTKRRRRRNQGGNTTTPQKPNQGCGSDAECGANQICVRAFWAYPGGRWDTKVCLRRCRSDAECGATEHCAINQEGDGPYCSRLCDEVTETYCKAIGRCCPLEACGSVTFACPTAGKEGDPCPTPCGLCGDCVDGQCVDNKHCVCSTGVNGGTADDCEQPWVARIEYSAEIAEDWTSSGCSNTASRRESATVLVRGPLETWNGQPDRFGGGGSYTASSEAPHREECPPEPPCGVTPTRNWEVTGHWDGATPEDWAVDLVFDDQEWSGTYSLFFPYWLLLREATTYTTVSCLGEDTQTWTEERELFLVPPSWDEGLTFPVPAGPPITGSITTAIDSTNGGTGAATLRWTIGPESMVAGGAVNTEAVGREAARQGRQDGRRGAHSDRDGARGRRRNRRAGRSRRP